MRDSFHEELERLQADILRMGNIVDEALGEAVQALADGDLERAQRVIDGDDRVDEMEIDIEQRSLALIALQQPMAGDLRVVGTALKLVTDLERIGDHATDIAKIVLRLDGEVLMKPLIDVPRMAGIVRKMIRETLGAYVDRNPAAAHTTLEMDDEVDHLYAQVFRELLTYMVEDPRRIKQGAHLLLVAQYLERVGDHATNLGEWVVYMVTGERVDLNR